MSNKKSTIYEAFAKRTSAFLYWTEKRKWGWI